MGEWRSLGVWIKERKIEEKGWEEKKWAGKGYGKGVGKRVEEGGAIRGEGDSMG